VRTEHDVDVVMDRFQQEWIPKLKLWEFDTIKRETAAVSFRAALAALPDTVSETCPSHDDLMATLTSTWTRRGLVLDFTVAARRFRSLVARSDGEELAVHHTRVVNSFLGWVDVENAPR
jgi:hypothetical protein